MHLIVCVDDRLGMSFCGRRLSRDKVVTEHILYRCAGHKLWIHPYSELLFAGKDIRIAPDFLDKAEEGDYCFAETTPLPEKIDNLESVILYHWNRTYPSTVKFPEELLAGMHMVHTEDFPGNSHDKITMEQYIL